MIKPQCFILTYLAFSKHKLICLAFLIVMLITLFSNCSVAPILESPRVRSGVKFETAFSLAKTNVVWSLSDSIMRNSVYSDEITNGFGDENAEITPLVKFAFADRVEFGGIYWRLSFNRGWDGRIKVALLEKGTSYLFRNLSGAALVGTKGSDGEWDHSSRNWVGFTLGTHHQLKVFEIEYIIMPTFGMNSFRNLDPGLGTAKVSFNDITITTGVTANVNQKLYSSIALSITKGFDNEFEIIQYDYSAAKIKSIWYDQVPLCFSFTLGYRFGMQSNR